MKILSWIQTFYPANIDFTIRQYCFITLDPEFLLWIQSFYSGSTVKLLLRIQSFSGSYISYYIVSKVFTLDPKLYSGSNVLTLDPRFLLQIQRSSPLLQFEHVIHHSTCRRLKVKKTVARKRT